jgi:hypothetical protein
LRTYRYFPWILLACAACGQGPREEIELPDPVDDTGPEEPPTDEESTAAFDPGPMMRLDVGVAASTGPAVDPMECASFSESAAIEKKPADIIFVVDNSPSMIEETQAVQERLNDFSAQIVEAGVDTRVMLLTSYPNPNLAPQLDTGICIDPPLGDGGCPESDTNPPSFAHVHQIIGSNHALQKILDTFEVWQPMMRPDSTKHLIVVSDDDSYLEAGAFDEQFRALDPNYADYRLHGIVSLQQCPASDALGEQYMQLAELTGGVLGDLCLQEFQPLFDTLGTAVLEGTNLACQWQLPAAPAGHVIDTTTVELALVLDGESLAPVHVEDPADCPADTAAWYWADPDAPQDIVACPSMCAAVQAALEASLEIDVGCAMPPTG